MGNQKQTCTRSNGGSQKMESLAPAPWQCAIQLRRQRTKLSYLRALRNTRTENTTAVVSTASPHLLSHPTTQHDMWPRQRRNATSRTLTIVRCGRLAYPVARTHASSAGLPRTHLDRAEDSLGSFSCFWFHVECRATDC